MKRKHLVSQAHKFNVKKLSKILRSSVACFRPVLYSECADHLHRFKKEGYLTKLTLRPLFTPDHRHLRQFHLIRFLVPASLFLFVLAYESAEHQVTWGEIDFQMISEVFYFGVLNPALVFLAFSHVSILLQELVTANRKAEEANHGLERQVVERTLALSTRNEELARANIELQKLDQMKSDFVAMVSHGLRSPLTNLSGALEVAMHSAPTQASPALHAILSIMAEENSRLLRFSQMVLDISRIDAGKLMLNPGPTLIEPLLMRVICSELANNDRSIHWTPIEKLPPVMADELYLAEILLILIDNADKYTPPSMPIEIGAVIEPSHPGFLTLTITDYGPGIPVDVQDKIFERFFRYESPTHTSTPGWGLGLYFAKILTEMQAGSLTLRSPVHRDVQRPGAQFILTLPIVEEGEDND